MNITIDLLSTNSIVTILCILTMIIGFIFGDSGKSTGWMFFLIPFGFIIMFMYWLYILAYPVFYAMLCLWVFISIIAIIKNNK